MTETPRSETERTDDDVIINNNAPSNMGNTVWIAFAVLAVAFFAYVFLDNYQIAPRGQQPVPVQAQPQQMEVAPAQSTENDEVIDLNQGLAKNQYAGNVYASDRGPAYNARWTSDGNRLWQPDLPQASLRQRHIVTFEVPQGEFSFNGVECYLYNSSGTLIVSRGNDLPFSSADEIFRVTCEGNESSGFEIKTR